MENWQEAVPINTFLTSEITEIPESITSRYSVSPFFTVTQTIDEVGFLLLATPWYSLYRGIEKEVIHIAEQLGYCT